MSLQNTNREAPSFQFSPLMRVTVLDEADELNRRADTPYLYLKSTVRNRNSVSRPVFNFSFADINQLLPEIEFQAEKDEPIQLIRKDTAEAPSDCESTKMAQEDAKSVRACKRTKLLEGACEMLWRIFVDISLQPEDLDLNEYELQLLKCIVSKKFNGEGNGQAGQEIGQHPRDELVHLIAELYKKHESKKRKEEKIKFVFKHTIKNLKKRFFVLKGLQNSPENEERFFLNYYEQIHKHRGLLIESFYDPLNTSHSQNPKFKTLSKDYLSLLFTSEGFKDDFLRYIEGDFVKDYQQTVCKKFKKLFKKLRKRMRQAKSHQHAVLVADFVDKFYANKRCKLPWTKREIEDAVLAFKAHLKNL